MNHSRRKVLRDSLALGLSAVAPSHAHTSSAMPRHASLPAPDPQSSITDVTGIKVGHFTDKRRPTGCTVILAEEGVIAGVEVRGAAPGTRETDLLDPLNTVEKIQAVVLSGGSAFGLDAASGVMRYLEERNIGFATNAQRVPIVPAAILYDLEIGDSKIRPDAEAGYKACKAASSRRPEEGNVGAGAGATIGKLFGLKRAMKGGVGTASVSFSFSQVSSSQLLDNQLTNSSSGNNRRSNSSTRRNSAENNSVPARIIVGAIVVVNAVGDIFDPQTGKLLAGARTANGKNLAHTMASVMQGEPLPQLFGGTATTLGIVATDARLDKVQATRVAQMAHDGLARTINPVHTAYDGDTIFALSTGRTEFGGNTSACVSLIGALAAEAISQAILRAIKAAKGIPDFPSFNDL